MRASRRVLGVGLALSACLSVTACVMVSSHKETVAGTTAAADNATKGKVAVLNIDKQTMTYGTDYTLTIGYENDTKQTPGVVRIRCRLVDAGGYQIAVSDVRLEGTIVGPIRPGFKIQTTTRLTSRVADATPNCEILEAE